METLNALDKITHHYTETVKLDYNQFKLKFINRESNLSSNLVSSKLVSALTSMLDKAPPQIHPVNSSIRTETFLKDKKER